jgi:magnesium chelatase family protein
MRKMGTGFDLPIAVGLLSHILDGHHGYHDQLSELMLFGELGLDGSVKRVNGILPAVIASMKHGYRHFIIPADNQYECEYIAGITIYPVAHFQEIVDAFRG